MIPVTLLPEREATAVFQVSSVDEKIEKLPIKNGSCSLWLKSALPNRGSSVDPDAPHPFADGSNGTKKTFYFQNP